MFKNTSKELPTLLKGNLSKDEFEWLGNAIADIEQVGTSRKLYLNYSLCGSKIVNIPLKDFSGVSDDLQNYLIKKGASSVEISRIWMLVRILEGSTSSVGSVKKLIQIADTPELETFLKYLVLLPDPKRYQFEAVEALRTNISTVFEAITKYNPYPSLFFTDRQWNQMYLKSAFMQLDLSAIVDIDKRANAELAKIISDYAHERWAALRPVDPYFWRPVTNFLSDGIMADIERLFKSKNSDERYAAALVCHGSGSDIAKGRLNTFPELKYMVESGAITWKNIEN